MTNRKLVMVWWVDADGNTDWADSDDIPDVVQTCLSIGWVYKDNKDVLVIVPHRSLGDRQVFGSIRIPKVCISKVRRIEDPSA